MYIVDVSKDNLMDRNVGPTMTFFEIPITNKIPYYQKEKNIKTQLLPNLPTAPTRYYIVVCHI